MLPRLFNLCRAAQGAAVEAALGRKVRTEGIAQEILRDHLLKFHVTWPAFFGAAPTPLPVDWADGGTSLCRAVFGPSGQAPATAADFFAFLDSDQPYAPVLKKIDGCFRPGEAVAADLSPVTPATIWSDALCDNSVAARVGDHPVMAAIAKTQGRGPLWRAAARLFDIAALTTQGIPAIETLADGSVVVPAARGSYAVRIGTDGDRIASLDRVTPTDHLLAQDGVLDRSLATLPADKLELGPLLLDILDPCSPVRLQEVRHA